MTGQIKLAACGKGKGQSRLGGQLLSGGGRVKVKA